MFGSTRLCEPLMSAQRPLTSAAREKGINFFFSFSVFLFLNKSRTGVYVDLGFGGDENREENIERD